MFATEWSKPQNTNTMIGNKTPTDALMPFCGAYFGDQTEKVMSAPHKIDEQNELSAQLSISNFAYITA